MGGKNNFSRGKHMPNNKDNKQSGSKDSMGSSSDREFESQGQNPISGSGGQNRQGQQGGTSGGYGKSTGSQQGGMMDEDDEMNTAGGRKGQFSDSDRGDESQWSPGSSGGSSDQ